MKKKSNEIIDLLVFVVCVIAAIPKYVWINMIFGFIFVSILALICILLYFEYDKYREKNELKVTDVNVEMKRIDKMNTNGLEFEQYIGSLYRKLGYNDVTVTQGSGDYGTDVVVGRDDKIICIQVKCHDISIKEGVKAVQQVCASLPYYNANKGVVITNTYFTEPAKRLARLNHVELIDRNELRELLIESMNIEKISFWQQLFPIFYRKKKVGNRRCF